MSLMELTKKLRLVTSIGLSDCKKAASAAVDKLGDSAEETKLIEEGVQQLRKMGLDKQMKKGERATQQGFFGTYVHHNGSIGVLVEVNCETDFVAKNEEFIAFISKLALHIAGAAPVSVSREDIPEEVMEKERDVYRAQLEKENKPENIREKIMEGKINAFCKEVCVVDQPMIGDNDGRTVNENLQELISKIGENIVIRRFIRWELGK